MGFRCNLLACRRASVASREWHRVLCLAVPALLAVLCAMPVARAQTTWQGTGADANWATTGNWSTALSNNFNSDLVFAGSAQLSNTNTLTGGTATSITFNADSGEFVVAGNSIRLGGNISNSSTNTQTISLDMTTTGVRTLTLTAGGGNLVLGGNISGAGGGFTLSGQGRATLSGSNSYTGNTTFAANQTLNINNNSALGSGVLVASNNGNFDNTSSSDRTIANNFNLSGGSPIFVGTGNLAITGTTTISGNNRTITVSANTLTLKSINADTTGRTFTKNGAGTLAITDAAGANLGGTFTLSGGTLILGNNAAMGTGGFTVTSSAGTLRASTDLTNVQNLFTLNNNLTVSGSGSITFSGLSQQFGSNRTLTSSLNPGKTLTFSGTTALQESGTGVGRTLTLAGTGNTTFSGPIVNGGTAGNSALTITNTGTTLLSASNSYAGPTTISAGTVVAAAAGAIPAGSFLAVNGGTLQMNTSQTIGTGTFAGTTGGISGVGILTGTAFTATNSSGTFTVAATLAGNTAGLTKSGAGVLVLSATTNTYGGITTISSGTLHATQLGNFSTAGSSIGSPGVGLVNTATTGAASNNSLQFIGNTTKALVYAGIGETSDRAIYVNQQYGTSTIASIVANGSGSLTLTGPISFFTSNSSAGGQFMVFSGTNAESNTYSGSFTTASPTTKPINIVKRGSGTWLLSGSTSYTGITVVEQGTLRFNSIANVGTNSALGTGSSNLMLPGSNVSVPYHISLGTGSTAGVLQYTGSSNGSSNRMVALLGNGTLDTGLAVGTLSFTGTVASFAASGVQTLTLAGSNVGSNTISGIVVDGTTGGSLALVKAGTGLWALTGTNTFSGATTVSAGILAIGSSSALQNTAGVTIAGGAGLLYTGAAATFAKDVTVTAGSGTGTITNSGGELLTLSGNLSKDNSVLRLTGGRFDVTGQITGATVGSSDLLIDGTSTVTLSAVNTYSGPTFVNQASNLIIGINNAIPNDSVVTLGNATTSGTLTLATFSDAIGGLAFGAGGGTLRIQATATSAPALTASTGTMTLTNGTLDLAGSGSTAGLYRVLSAQSIAGSFASISGTSAAYQVITSSTSVDYQQRAILGPVTVTNPTTAIITGGSAAFAFSVTNSAFSGGAGLSVTAAGLSNVIGAATGTAAAASSTGSLSGLVFTGTSIGGQQGTFTVDAPSGYGPLSTTGTVAVTVLEHALPGFVASGVTDPYSQTTLALDFGAVNESAGMQSLTYSLTNLASLVYGAGFTAELDLVGFTADSDGFSSGLTTFNDLVAGGTSSLFTATFNPTSQGAFSKSFILSFSDKQSLSGASARRDLTINAQVIVVPEPGAMALAGIGAILAGWSLARCRRR
jgi:fibronectin-binding autotransporter adhesin